MTVPTNDTTVATPDAVAAPTNETQVETPESVSNETNAQTTGGVTPEAQQAAEAPENAVNTPVDTSENVPTGEQRTYKEDDVKPLPTEAMEGENLTADEIPDDIKRLLEEPNGPFQLASGDVVVIRQLKFREFLRLLRIVTRGASSTMQGMSLNFDDTDSFVQTLLALTLFAIPEAEDEVIVFVQSMVDPAELTGNKRVDDQKRINLYNELSNPEMEDVVNIVAKIIAAEGADLQALGKRLMNMWSMASKMGATKGIPTN